MWTRWSAPGVYQVKWQQTAGEFFFHKKAEDTVIYGSWKDTSITVTSSSAKIYDSL